jgi:hypothetical protein
MWNTVIPVAIAGAIVASLANLGSEINNIRAASQGFAHHTTAQSQVSSRSGMYGSLGSSAQRTSTPEPGA